MRYAIAVAILVAVAGCASSPSAGGATVVWQRVWSDGQSETVRATGPRLRGDGLSGAGLPQVELSRDGSVARIGVSKISWRAAKADAGLLLWLGAAIMLGAGLAAWAKAYAAAIMLGTVGAGLIAAFFYPWLALLSALAGAAYLIWPVVEERAVRLMNRGEKTPKVAAEPSEGGEGGIGSQNPPTP